MTSDLYAKEYIRNLSQLKGLVPEQMQSYRDFSAAVFSEGVLSKREKELIAVAITHVTECPYCIDFHTKAAKKAGATLEELAESVFVAVAVEAGGAITHSTHVHNAKQKDAPDVLYARSNLQFVGQLGSFAPEGFKGYQAFSAAATKVGNLSAKFKEIIAVAVANASQCPYCIDVHTKKAEQLGATNEELAEAVMVTSVVRAGGAYVHMANMIQSFREEE
ncbi:carboxymuconolactone decarboxylase family protein [Niallia oryzisoli]|uniref:carboxymuconolactone decarboxylase family protein n=1 Tax=Niallia oryzisoli TaxID=1737571 RepID=UPI003736F55B